MNLIAVVLTQRLKHFLHTNIRKHSIQQHNVQHVIIDPPIRPQPNPSIWTLYTYTLHMNINYGWLALASSSFLLKNGPRTQVCSPPWIIHLLLHPHMHALPIITNKSSKQRRTQLLQTETRGKQFDSTARTFASISIKAPGLFDFSSPYVA